MSADLVVRASPILDLPRSAEIVIEGGVNASNAALLKEKIDRAIDRKTTFLSILMKNVSYVNSSGFGYLMDLAGMLDRRGGAITLVEVQPKIKVIFNNLGMQNFFRFEASGETARAYLRGLAEKVARSPRVIPLDGPDEGVEFPLIGPAIRIGGDAKSTILIKHPEVELRHAEIYRSGETCFVKDLGTRHGTWMGMRKVNDESLGAGDVVKVGTIRLAFFPAGAVLKK
jgi:anti-anti-sigma factor